MKKTLNLLLKSSFRNTAASWPIVLGLTLLIALLSIVISLMTSINSRVVQNYHSLDKVSNLRDAVINLQPDEFTGARGDSKKPTNVIEAQQYFIYNLEQQYQGEKSKYDFYWTRTEGRDFQGIKNGNNDLKIKTVAKTNPLTSADKNGNVVGVDQLAISQGHAIQSAKQIVIDATFARINKVKIGDIIRVQEDTYGDQLEVKSAKNWTDRGIDASSNIDYQRIQGIKDLDDPKDVYSMEYSTYNWFEVVGFGESADYTMPVIDQQSTLPNKKTELVAYVDPSQFGLFLDTDHKEFQQMGLYWYDATRGVLQSASTGDSDSYYSLKFKDANFKASKSDIERMNADFIKLINKPSNSKYIYLNGDDSYLYGKRTSALKSTIYIYHVISGVILAVVAVIVLFSIVLVSKKQIDKTRSQIGIMKATGYYKRQIVWNYVTMPFITSIVGGIIGFVISQGVQGLIINLFNKFFNLDITGWRFDWLGFIICVVVMWFVICAISFGIAYYVMRADTLELLGAARASHMSRFGLALKNLEKSPKIYPRMEASLLASNSGKMISVTGIVLIATIIMTATFTLPTMLNKNKTDTFKGLKYNQVVDFQEPVYNNPYTFFRTWDPEVKNQNYQYASDLGKITALPVDKDGKGYLMTGSVMDNEGKKPIQGIIDQLASQKLGSEYYDLEFDANEDANTASNKEDRYNTQLAAPKDSDDDSPEALQGLIKQNAKSGKLSEDELQKLVQDYIKADADKKSATPSALDTLTANTKMLSMYNTALSNKYFKLVSDWAIRDPFGWNILANQWPKYLELTRDLRSISDDANGKATQNSVLLTFRQLQSFYKTFVESVGLTVSRDYYNYNTIGNDAYVNRDYKKQIDLYNSANNEITNNNAVNKEASAKSYKDERFGTEPMFGDVLSKLDVNEDATHQFQLSDGTHKGIAMNHILKGAAVQNPSDIDKYLTADPDKMSISEMEAYIQDYLQWYGCYFSQRSGTAIVQAGYTRPPYFVQQYMKKAYNADDNSDIYRFTFANIPFNPDTEQLGTKLHAQSKTVKGKKDLDFNIYGIQDSHKYLDLKDTKGNDLINRLFSGDDTYDQYQTASIVINQSLAKAAGIHEGDTVDMNVLYTELENMKDGQKPLSVDDWSQPNVRLNNKNKDGFISFNDVDTFNTMVDGNKFTAGDMNLTNAPSDFYTSYLDGNYANKQVKKDTKLKVIGIHDGYGSPMAWMRNSDANDIAGYNADKEYFWNTFFTKQFAAEFTKPIYKETKYAFDKDLTNIGYGQWIDTYVNGTPSSNVSQTEINAAKEINKVFDGAYPIFNYKYSMSDDIGDLQSAVSTWVQTGDYSPIAEDGGIAGDKTYDGMGTGSILDMLPTKITKNILNEMTSVIMAVVIIIIVLVIILAFIIIMLTTSLVISDNQTFISTMKVLGYSNTQIVDTILGMYAISIVAAFVVGFIIGWFMLQAIITNMALSGGMVLPLGFPAFLIFAVIAAVCGLYVITFAIGFVKISRSDPLAALKDSYM